MKRKEPVEVSPDKREAMLDVAEKLFADKGFDGVSTREIAKEANLNIAMIAYYFGSKEELLKEVLERRIRMLKVEPPFLSNIISAHEKLISVSDYYVDRFFDTRLFNQIMYQEMGMESRSEIVNHILKKWLDNFEFVRHIIQEGIKNKEFRKVDVEFTILTIIGVPRMYMISHKMAFIIMKSTAEEEIYSTTIRKRIKRHLADFIKHHLVISK